jgi:two-component system phosphate regulon sensor histidine kinase PhoR
MGPRGTLSAVLAVAGLPWLLFVLLAVSGRLAIWPAFAAVIVAGVGAWLLALIWLRDLERLAETLRRASGDPLDPLPAGPLSLDRLILPQTQAIGREIEYLSRALAARAALVGRMRRADEVIVEQLPDPLIVLGADRAVRRANAAARAAFGADMLAVLRHPGLRAATDRAFAQRSTQTAELTIPVPVTREVFATVIYVDTPLEGGGQAIAVLSDRSRERAVERMRADFAANASHELRTPLASLIGFIDTLRGPASDDPPAQRRFLGIMAEQAARMNRLIDDLLSLSRIELVEHQRPEGVVDLAQLASRLAAAFEPRVAEAGVSLDWQMPRSLPCVTGDEDQLAQVVQNLLDNAVKYGRRSGTVRLSTERSEAGASWPGRSGVVLTVSDDGPGIPRRHLPRLTERFYRVDTGRSRAVGGTGLGLAIVKHVVNRHRGQLLIESEEGVGTTVRVWLPEAPAPAALESATRD